MQPSSPVIRLESVSKRFVVHQEKSLKERLFSLGRGKSYKSDFWALKDVEFDIMSGTTVGLIGANGSGKSTLLKVIGGIIEPTKGEVYRKGRLAALLELGAGFHPDLTGRENVFLNAAMLGMTRAETLARFDDIVDFSGMEPFIDTQVKFYSSGMYVRLAFAVAVHVDPDILLLDEVLAVGDEPFQLKCLDKIKSFQHEGRTIIMVTHSLPTVGDMCDRAIVMNHGDKLFDGDVPTALTTLRDIFSEESHGAQAAHADGVPQPYIASARILDRSGSEVTKIQSGDSVQYELVIESPRVISDWYVTAGIDGTLGQTVFATDTTRLGAKTEPFSGRRVVRFDLPNLRLGNDRYTLHSALGTIGEGTLDAQPSLAKLDVEDGTTNLGTLSVPATVEIVADGAAQKKRATA